MKKQITTTRPTDAQKAEASHRVPVYKVCRLGTVNGIYSALAGKYGKCEPFTRLSYKVGEVTTAPAGGEIFVYLDHAFATDQATKMAKRYPGVKVSVFTAKPLGNVTIPAGKSKTATCRAIILSSLLKAIKIVPPPHPAPVWKDVTAECSVYIETGYAKGIAVHVQHNGQDITRLSAVGKSNFPKLADYKLELAQTGKMWDYFKVMHKT